MLGLDKEGRFVELLLGNEDIYVIFCRLWFMFSEFVVDCFVKDVFVVLNFVG